MHAHSVIANSFSRSHDDVDCAYTLIKSGPDFDPSEVENEREESVEVMILWGSTVLHVQHLTPPRSFYVGEAEGERAACDYLVPAEKLGMGNARTPIVLRHARTTRLVIPRGATGTIEMPGHPAVSIEDALCAGQTEPCEELPGARQIVLPAGARARLHVQDLAFHVATVAAGKRVGTGLFSRNHASRSMYTGLSLLAHAVLAGSMAFFVPPMGLADAEAAHRDQQYLIQQYLTASADRDAERRSAEAPETTADSSRREGGRGEQAKDSEGSMGNPASRKASARYTIAGPKDNPDPHLGAIHDARTFGLIGMLNAGMGGDPNAPRWGRDQSLGTDPVSAQGNMWGDTMGDAFGVGGFGLSGVGEGGGGSGEGIGLDRIGTLDHGGGGGISDGFGRGHDRLGPTHATRGPTLRQTDKTAVNGQLPPEIIQRIVRQNYGRFRMCYETGLRSNPSLQGRVAVRFVIGRDGAVSMASNSGSDLPDATVVQCVVRAYYNMTFPQPERGLVTVVYPILFTPGE